MTLNVIADGGPPLRYQWKRDRQELPGKTGAALDLGNITGSQAGAYNVAVTDSTGAAISSDLATLLGGAWAAVNAPVKVEGDRSFVLVTPSGGEEFFRLQK